MATNKENYQMTKERDDLHDLCDAIERLMNLIHLMQHRGTIFVIQDRLNDELGGSLEEYLDESTDALHREARHRITELVG